MTQIIDATGIPGAAGRWGMVTGRTFDEDWVSGKGGLLLPPTYGSQRWRYGPAPIAISLFTGAGGFDLGFTSAGWNVVAASEMDPMAALTYLFNLGAPDCVMHFVTKEDERRWRRALETQWRLDRQNNEPPYRIGGNPYSQSLLTPGRMAGTGEPTGEPHKGCQHFWLGDMRKVTGAEILTALGLERGDVDAVMGGPPCQGFSMAGRREVMDPRNSLVFDFARVVLEIRPKTFVMENVPGITSMVTPEGIPVIDGLCRILSDGGFGTFDALKKTLAGTAGVGMGMENSRGSKGSGRSRKPELVMVEADAPSQSSFL